jgi:hypothetical protein
MFFKKFQPIKLKYNRLQFNFRPNYEARNIRLNSVTGWCGKQEAFTYVSVDLGQVYRVKVRRLRAKIYTQL